MKNNEKVMSINSQVFWGKTFVGFLWIGAGISGMFDTLFFNFLHMLFLACAVVLMVVILRAKRENDDEMSEYNYMKAKAISTTIMHIIYCIAMIASALCFGLLQDAGLSWGRIIARIFFIIMGIQDVVIGIVFHRLEAE